MQIYSGHRDMGRRTARGQSSSPHSDRSESYNLLTQDSSGDELPSFSKHLLDIIFRAFFILEVMILCMNVIMGKYLLPYIQCSQVKRYEVPIGN